MTAANTTYLTLPHASFYFIGTEYLKTPDFSVHLFIWYCGKLLNATYKAKIMYIVVVMCGGYFLGDVQT